MTREQTKKTTEWVLKAIRRYCQQRKCPCDFVTFCGLRSPAGMRNAEIEVVAEAIADNEERRKQEVKNDD